MKKTKMFIASLLLLFVLVACSNNDNDANKNKPSDGAMAQSSDNHPLVTILMENDDVIEIELYPETAPNTVNNFISLVEDGYYDGVIFHRVIPGFMIQGGDPDGTGSGGPGYSIKGEFTNNGFDNDLAHSRGVISMARTQAPDSAGSQFFIMHQDSPSLDGEYAAFGEVISGIEVVDTIVNVETQQDKPVAGQEQVMKKVTVDLNGETFDAPEIIE